MTRSPRRATAALACAALAAGVLLSVTQAAPASARTGVAAAPATTGSRHWDRTFYSAPPLPAQRARSTTASGARPPRTRGVVTGRVVGPHGTPIRHALVVGLRFADLGAPLARDDGRKVLTRTDRSGRFRLRQLTEGYLVRVCSESRSVKGECDQDTTKRFTPTYVGPSGRTDSFLRQTQLFTPQAKGRDLGTVLVQPPAVVAGTFKDGAHQTVYLTRIDGSIAARTTSDRKGDYRFEVAPGPYRVEVDKDPGLRTADTVPGFSSRRLTTRAGRTTRVSFRARHAGVIRGTVTGNGAPLGDQLVVILDADGEFAAGVVSDAAGRYQVSSLQPGTYFVTTSYTYSGWAPTATAVTIAGKGVLNADLALSSGSSISFSLAAPNDLQAVDAELRNAAGRVVKTFEGVTGLQAAGKVTFTGLPAGAYTLYVRQAVAAGSATPPVALPWASRSINLTGIDAAEFTAVPLDQPGLTMSGTLPHGTQVRLTAVPEDSWLRAAYVDGGLSTPLAVAWTVTSSNGAYAIPGLVNGSYAAAVTTAVKVRGSHPTSTGANVAATHSTVTVNVPTGTTTVAQAFTAPAGAKVRGKLVYAGSRRPVVAPFGVQVVDAGDQSWSFPTVSVPQKYGKGFRVERLHAGSATAQLLDLDRLYAEDPTLLIPDALVSSAHGTEPGTPYWLTAPRRVLALAAGTTLDLGTIPVKVHGVVRGG